MTNRQQHLQEFYSAPESTLFDQKTIAAVRGVSVETMERDRWAGKGIAFKKIGRSVRYSKRDVLDWLNQFQPQKSTSV